MISLYAKIIIAALMLFGMSKLHAQPSNDDPCGALVLPVNNDGYYCPTANVCSTNDATNTDTSVVSAPDCSSGNADVWYKFVATATSHRLTRTEPVPVVAGFINPGMGVYSSTGGLCTTLSEITCNTSSITTNLTGLTVGSTYYVRLWTANATANPAYSINLCVGSSPLVPPNDLCANAIAIDNGQTQYQYTNNATESFPAHDCGWGASSTGALDVWYTFTAVMTGNVTLIATGFESLINLEVYTNCSGSTLVNCVDDAVGMGVPLPLTISAVAGNTYYVRLYGREGSGYVSVQASGSPLPINMIDLQAKATNAGVLLNWAADEQRFSDFEISRSEDGKHFTSLDDVSAGDPTAYNYVDYSNRSASTYYRISGVLQSNNSKVYSNIVKVVAEQTTNKITVFPNPANNILKVDFGAAPPQGLLTIENLAGQVMHVSAPKQNSVEINISAYPAQVYFLRYRDNSTNNVTKFIKY